MPRCKAEGCDEWAIGSIIGEDGYERAYRCADCLLDYLLPAFDESDFPEIDFEDRLHLQRQYNLHGIDRVEGWLRAKTAVPFEYQDDPEFDEDRYFAAFAHHTIETSEEGETPENDEREVEGDGQWRHIGNLHADGEWYECSRCGRESVISYRSDQYQEHGEPEPCECWDGETEGQDDA